MKYNINPETNLATDADQPMLSGPLTEDGLPPSDPGAPSDPNQNIVVPPQAGLPTRKPLIIFLYCFMSGKLRGGERGGKRRYDTVWVDTP